jgi:hypothetical protein
MDVKKIVVNLDSLQQKSSKKQTKKRSSIVPNKLKDAFLKQVQHHKSLANAQKQTPETTTKTVVDNKYANDFKSSIEYLNNIKKTMQPIHTELPVELLEPEPKTEPMHPKLIEPMTIPEREPLKYAIDTAVPYGCLKNGIKPSFKNWTRNNRQQEPKQEPTQAQKEPTQAQKEPTQAQKEPMQAQKEPIPIQKEPITTIKRHVIGKSKKSRLVGVLIKNINTRKMITTAHKDLKKININEVRNHLKNNGMLKVGTTAPIDVLRQTYEASILAGVINNKNDDTLLHNFVNDKEF